MTKKKLEILLESCRGYDDPKAKLEQYTIPSSIAAEVLYHAYLKNDIEGKVVYDFGCGTGRLAIGCALLGAIEVCGIDADEHALKIARENAEELGVNVKWINCNVEEVKTRCDTVVQNPPFGVKNRRSDRTFLKKALESGGTVYSMHKSTTREFIVRYIEELGGRVTDIMTVKFVLPHSYDFHRKPVKKINVDVYRMKRR